MDIATATIPRPIMLVDEDDDVLALMRRALVAGGHRVVTWRRRADLQAAVEAQAPALVLLDPAFRWYGDPMAIVAALRRRPATRRIPLVVWTADRQFLGEYQPRLRALGVAAYPKPAALEALLAEIAARLAPA